MIFRWSKGSTKIFRGKDRTRDAGSAGSPLCAVVLATVVLALSLIHPAPCPCRENGSSGHEGPVNASLKPEGTTHQEGQMGQKGGKLLSGPVFKVRIDGAINPGTCQLLERALRAAEHGGASLLIVELDTPGGLVTSLRKMVKLVMGSPVPVCVYVSPSGAQAASAGALLTLSAHIAAMAPGTNIGAAHPVDPSGKMDKDSIMGQKVENDLAAMAKAIAEERGRNAKWAEEAVRRSVSATSSEALEAGVIDIVAEGLQELLEQIRGRQVRTSAGLVRIMPDEGPVQVVKENLRDKILKAIADPNIAYILMMIGVVGLYFELAHPGAIFPGTAGAICLVLGLYAMHTLPVNAVGIVLIVLSVIFFIMELFIVSHGLLGLAGVVCLVLGSIMLFDQEVTGMDISSSILWPTVITVSISMATILFIATKAMLKRPRTGREGLIGLEGVVREKVDGDKGLVFLHGELWSAESSRPIPRGRKVKVVGINGLRLVVEPVDE